MSEKFPPPGTESPGKEVVWATTAEGIVKERVAEINKIAMERGEQLRETSSQLRTISPDEGRLTEQHARGLKRTQESIDKNVLADLREVGVLSQGLHKVAAGYAPEATFVSLVEALLAKEARYLSKEWVKDGSALDDSVRGKHPSSDRQLASMRVQALQDFLEKINGLPVE